MHTIVIATSPDHNCADFINRIKQTSCTFTVLSFEEWNTKFHNIIPTGFVYLRVAPELALKRIDSTMSLTQAEQQCILYDDYFLHKKSLPHALHEVPLIILNGNVHIDSDFSQFYTHLFSLKKFVETIENEHRLRNGQSIIKKKKKCGC